MPLNDLVTSDADFEVESNTPSATPEPAERPEAPPEPVALKVESDDDIDTGDKPVDKAETEKKARSRSLEGRKQTIQEQINALVREKGTTARERDEIAAETQRLRAERDALQRDINAGRPRDDRQPAPQGARPEQEAWGRTDARDPEPQEDQFDDFALYVRAQSSWAAREAVRVNEHRQAQQREGQSRERYESQRQQGHAERYTAFAQSTPGFEEEVNREDLLLSAPMVDVIKDSSVGPQLMLFLARNPGEVERLAGMHPVLAYGEMKKHEARQEAAYSGSAPAGVKPISKARPPIRPVESAGAVSGETEPNEDDDMDTFIEKGNALDKRRRSSGQRA